MSPQPADQNPNTSQDTSSSLTHLDHQKKQENHPLFQLAALGDRAPVSFSFPAGARPRGLGFGQYSAGVYPWLGQGVGLEDAGQITAADAETAGTAVADTVATATGTAAATAGTAETASATAATAETVATATAGTADTAGNAAAVAATLQNESSKQSKTSIREDLQDQCARLAAAMSTEPIARPKPRDPTPEFRGFDDADYLSAKSESETRDVQDEDQSDLTHHRDRDEGEITFLAPTSVAVIVNNPGPQLGEIDIRSLTPEQILVYFGVLSLQQRRLEPLFEYTQDPNSGWWSTKITLIRDSLTVPALESLRTAKVEGCRLALSILKLRYSTWCVPDEPSGDLTSFTWRWHDLLQVYSAQMKLPSPELTRYIHEKGFRYQVDVGTVTSLGKRKFYDTEDQAIEASCHEVLYLLLIREGQELHEATLAAASRLEQDQISAEMSPSLPTMSTTTNTVQKPVATFAPMPTTSTTSTVLKPIATMHPLNRVTKSVRPEQPKYSPRGGRAGTNFKLPPVVNPRISMEPVHREPEPVSKWKLTPSQLNVLIAHKRTYREKYEEICTALKIESKLIVEKGKKAWTISAIFTNDPFLKRAGPIGLINGYCGTEAEATELCCKKVVKYLVQVVQDEYNLFEAARRLGKNYGKGYR